MVALRRPAAPNVRADAASVLFAAGLWTEAERVRKCGRDWIVGRCDRDSRHVGDMPVLCGHRLCPDCSPRIAARQADKYVEGCCAFKYPVMLTCTVGNLENIEAEDLRRIRRAFTKLRRRQVLSGHTCSRRCKRCPARAHHGWKCRGCQLPTVEAHREAKKARRSPDGGAWCRLCKCPGERGGVEAGLIKTECTNKGKGWHIHLHVVMDLGRSGPIDNGWVGMEWADVARGEGFTVGNYPIHLERITEGFRNVREERDGKVTWKNVKVTKEAAIRYALKYTTKEGFPDGEAWRWARAIKGNRLVQPFGALRAKQTHEGWVVDATASPPILTPWPRATHRWMVRTQDGCRKSNRAPVCHHCNEHWSAPATSDAAAASFAKAFGGSVEDARGMLAGMALDRRAKVVGEARELRDPDAAARLLLAAGAPVAFWRPVGMFSRLLKGMEDIEAVEFDEALLTHLEKIVERERDREKRATDGSTALPLSGLPG